jgi:integrase
VSFHLRRYENSPYWYARITRPDGSRGNWKSTRKARKHDARLVAEQWDAAATSNHRIVTLDESLELLAAHKERKRVTDHTMEAFSLKGSHVRSFFGPLRDIQSIQLIDTEAYWDMRRALGISDATVAKELGTLLSALRRCSKLSLYRGDWTAIWPEALPKSFPGRKRWLPWEEYIQVLDEIAVQWRDHTIVYTSTGVRFSELYVLRAHNVRNGWLHIDGTKTDGSVRDIPLSVEAQEAFDRRVATSTNGVLFPITSPNIDDQKRAWLRALAAACRRLKIEHASTNDLRRTFCSWAHHRGVAEQVVVGWMGHRSSKMVREVYAQPSRKVWAEEMKKMPTRHLPPVDRAAPPLPN